MKSVKRISALLLAMMMLLSLCACGSSRSSAGKSSAQTETGAYSYNSSYDVAEEAMPMAMMDYDGDYGFSAVETSAAAYGNGAGAGSGAGSSDAPAENPDKIIYSSDVTVETTQFDETIGRISGLVEEYGGWIESSSVSGSNYYQKSRGSASTRDASYTLRIPSGRFQELMDGLMEFRFVGVPGKDLVVNPLQVGVLHGSFPLR